MKGLPVCAGSQEAKRKPRRRSPGLFHFGESSNCQDCKIINLGISGLPSWIYSDLDRNLFAQSGGHSGAEAMAKLDPLGLAREPRNR